MEDTFQEGQEKEEQQDKSNIKEEDNAIEMSEDFDGQMHDGDEREPGGVINVKYYHVYQTSLLFSPTIVSHFG